MFKVPWSGFMNGRWPLHLPWAGIGFPRWEAGAVRQARSVTYSEIV